MNNIKQFIFPGAMLGSLILASFGYTVMASAPIEAFTPDVPVAASPELEPDGSSNGEEVSDLGASIDSNSDDEKDCKINSGFPDKIRQWCTQIMRHSNKNNLDPNLVAALIWQESGGNPTAYSKSGAVGLMQVMPRDGIAASFQCINGPCFVNRPSIDELQKPNFNVKYGTGMLAGLLSKYGNMREALKFYGPMDVGYYYADKVLGIFNNYGS